MSDLQLERSVLEAKEREELFAIAQALGSSLPARTKKADLVARILEATGVEPPADGAGSAKAPAPAADKVRKPRARRAAAKEGDGPEQLALGAVAPADHGDTPTPLSSGQDGSAEAELADTPPSVNGHTNASVNGHGDTTNSVAVAAHGRVATGPASRGATREAPAPVASETAGEGLAGDGQAGYNTQSYQRSDYGRGRPEGDGGLGNSRRRRRRNRDKPSRGDGRGVERDLVAQPEAPYSGELVTCSGLLDLRDEGYGFLRTSGYLASSADVYVSITQVRRFGLRKGDLIEGAYRPAASNEKYPALVRVDSVSGLPPEEARNRPKFENLTPLFPDEKLRLEIPGDPANVTARIVDLISPIGKGQRGLIVSPPKAGKTTVLKQIAHSIEANNPEVYLMVLLVDERPEEVTDMRRSVKGEVVASTFDRPADEHTQVAELAIERAKRMVELGRDVVIVLDGITRLARAYNLAQPATGRIMSGGIDTGALYPPKKFFGSARNIEEGGSLTILATALVETGSRMDEVIFEEFKGTGNMELRLDRKLAERRIYPALDVNASSTRHEELLFDRGQLQQVWKLRRVLNALATDGNGGAGLELLVDKIKTTRSNEQFLADIAKQPAPAI
jgi:transcription termination factor Rho